MKFGMVVVLYKPSDDVLNKIKNYNDFGVEVVIVDNSPKDYITYELEQSKIFYIKNYNIGGIAKAFNLGLDFLLEKECDFLFTFDQDSIIPHDFFNSMELFITKSNANFVCPDFFDVNSKTNATFIKLTKWRYNKIERDNINQSCNVAFAISSGMGFSKNTWLDLRYYNEDFIIDHGDTDFCLKALKKGYKIKVNFDICLNHAIGEREVKKLLGVTFKPNHHSYIRKYYIVRNGTYLSFKYFFSYPSFFYLNCLRIVHETVCVCFYEDEKTKKLKAMFIGLIHAIRGKLGVFK